MRGKNYSLLWGGDYSREAIIRVGATIRVNTVCVAGKMRFASKRIWPATYALSEMDLCKFTFVRKDFCKFCISFWTATVTYTPSDHRNAGLAAFAGSNQKSFLIMASMFG